MSLNLEIRRCALGCYQLVINGELVTHQHAHCRAGLTPHSNPAASLPDLPTLRAWQRLQRRQGSLRVEFLQCRHCTRLAVAVEDHRVTDHKCAGHWTMLEAARCVLPAMFLKRWIVIQAAQERAFRRAQALFLAEIDRRIRRFLKVFAGTSAQHVMNTLKAATPRGRRREIVRFYQDNPRQFNKTDMAHYWAYGNLNWSVPFFVKGIALEKLAAKRQVA